MNLHLGGSLAWYDEQKRSHLTVELAAPVSLKALLKRLAIPISEIGIISINGNLMEDEDCMLLDTDSLKLYPPMGGGAWITK